MLKGTRDGILKRLQPVSIHGQVICDVFFTSVEDPDGQVHVARLGPEEDPDGQVHVARLGPEAVADNIEPGDRIRVEYLVGTAVKVTRVVPT